jgi:hypothetical protein
MVTSRPDSINSLYFNRIGTRNAKLEAQITIAYLKAVPNGLDLPFHAFGQAANEKDHR